MSEEDGMSEENLDVMKLYVVMADDIQYDVGDYWLVGVYLTPEDAKEACEGYHATKIEEYSIIVPRR